MKVDSRWVVFRLYGFFLYTLHVHAFSVQYVLLYVYTRYTFCLPDN